MALKFYHDQTRSNTFKQGQCRNGKMFGHQTMFDGAWSPNIPFCPGPNLKQRVFGTMVSINSLSERFRDQGEEERKTKERNYEICGCVGEPVSRKR